MSMKLSRPQVVPTPDGAKLTGTVQVNGEPRELYFEVGEAYAKFLTPEVSDAFVVAILPYAMKAGQDIVCEAPVTAELLHNLNEVLIPVLASQDDRLTAITVRAAAATQPLGGHEIGTGVSLGVDSFYTIQQYATSPYDGFRLTCLLNISSHGINDPVVKDPAFSAQHRREVSEAADLVMLPVVLLDTNVKEAFPGENIFTHVYTHLSAVLAMRKLWGAYYYSTGLDISHFRTKDNSTDDSDGYLLLLAYALSTRELPIRVSGMHIPRHDKIASLASFEPARRHLRVCLREVRNCGHCEKCVRTLLALDMLGLLDAFSDVFDVKEFRQTRAECWTLAVQEMRHPLLEPMYSWASTNDPAVLRQAARLLRHRETRLYKSRRRQDAPLLWAAKMASVLLPISWRDAAKRWYHRSRDEVIGFHSRHAPAGLAAFLPGAIGRDRHRILLLTDRDSENVGDQLIERCAIALLRTVMKNLGARWWQYSIRSQAAGIIPREYISTGDETLLLPADDLIRGSTLIVFGGAPLFNSRYENFYARTIKTIEIATKYGVPMVFSSLGVERFDAASQKCLALKRALNNALIRQITTRDDIASLEKYTAGSQVPIAKVSDPVVFAGTVMGRFAARRRGQKVGLFTIRGAAFVDNGIDFTPDDQIDFWQGVTRLLEARGVDYEILTTGYGPDEVFLDQLRRRSGLADDKFVLHMDDPEHLVAKLSSFAGVIAFRLHASVTSYACGTPSVGLAWNPKVPQFYESIGYPGRVLTRPDWQPEPVVDALVAAMREGVRQDLAYNRTVYDTLFAALRPLVRPGSRARPYDDAQLLRALSPFQAVETTSD